ncbi:hypothetical protein Y032_0085g1850 [Ancylostoma ceylanicum]|uniref:Uncharacterized protein n=1 Tax=Ancylostoma ceylanicum TaxID=53326 RepID=A0A016TQ43_9BILA|nr:hypothetical protein Y032_0085g1850 [Ancylostoma ceylanicum]
MHGLFVLTGQTGGRSGRPGLCQSESPGYAPSCLTMRHTQQIAQKLRNEHEFTTFTTLLSRHGVPRGMRAAPYARIRAQPVVHGVPRVAPRASTG